MQEDAKKTTKAWNEFNIQEFKQSILLNLREEMKTAERFESFEEKTAHLFDLPN